MRLYLAFLFSLFSFFSIANASTIDGFPAVLTFFEEPQVVNFTIFNNSAIDNRVSIELLAPVDINGIAPLKIAAGKSAIVSLELFPRKEMLGQQYEGALIVNVGSIENSQRVKIFFKSNSEKPATENDSNSNIAANVVTGIVSFVAGFPNEIVFDIVLILIVLILAIALIARIIKRIKR